MSHDLMNQNLQPDLPHHIAIIMDGNGRWAQRRGLLRTEGHNAGVSALRNVVEACVELKIPALTVFAFSSENWSRPETEVKFLFNLILLTFQKEIKYLHEENVRIRIIGERDRLPSQLQKYVPEIEELTKNNTGMQFTLALNYGGRWDILQTAKKLATEVAQGKLTVDDITEEKFNKEMCLGDLPAPDLLIRTSGEQRISNFLLWQIAYSELYFTNIQWPDFSKEDLIMAVQEYATRHRRFGLTSEQIKQLENR